MNNNDYLIHHGVPGQKWGNRRYQNKDGTRTELGKRHRLGGILRVGKNKDEKSPTVKALKESSNLVREIRNTAISVKNSNKKQDPNVRNMSDEELRRRINRMELERRYNTLNSENTRSGKDVVMDILNIAGGALGAAAAGFAIADSIRSRRS